jgi:hypothetical protein
VSALADFSHSHRVLAYPVAVVGSISTEAWSAEGRTVDQVCDLCWHRWLDLRVRISSSLLGFVTTLLTASAFSLSGVDIVMVIQDIV